ncbi:MAG: HAD hydrolase-like protein [bacterium]|nr:HAD hydrolase-like protein [bacterium]
MKRHILFDFDGTIADSFPHIFAIACELLEIYPNEEELERLRNTPIKQLLKKYNIKLYQLPGMLLKGRAMFESKIDELHVVYGFEQVLFDLKKKGYDLQIVSSNSNKNINKFLKNHPIKGLFSHINGNVGVFSKANALKKIMRKQGIDKANCIYVGDELRDVEASHKIKLDVIAVSWGLNGKDLLYQAKPTELVDDPKDFVSTVERIFNNNN